MRATTITAAVLALALAGEGAAQVQLERRKPAPPKGELSVENPFGSIVVRGWEKPEVLVRGTLAAGAQELSFDGDKDDTWIGVDVPESWFHAPGEDAAFRSTLEIHAPMGSKVSIETVNAEVTVEGFSGRIAVATINGGVRIAAGASAVEVESMTGSIAVEARVAAMELRTVSGAVTAKGAAGEVRIETVSGTVDLEGAGFSALQIQTVTGKVTVAGTLAQKGGVEIETFSGPVELRLPKNARSVFELQTFGGAIKSDFCAGTPVTRERFEPFRQLRCSTGPDDFEIQVKTHDGDVVLTAQ
jgi:hypothetical protein